MIILENFYFDRKDNGKEYSCKASNSATGDDNALSTSVPLKVLFKPAFVNISVEPSEPKAGQKAILTCISDSSNPTARIIWRYKNKHYNGVDASVKSGAFGGNITTNMLEIEIKPEDHGAIIICEAVNDELQESVHNALTLSVKCKYIKVNYLKITQIYYSILLNLGLKLHKSWARK